MIIVLYKRITYIITLSISGRQSLVEPAERAVGQVWHPNSPVTRPLATKTGRTPGIH